MCSPTSRLCWGHASGKRIQCSLPGQVSEGTFSHVHHYADIRSTLLCSLATPTMYIESL